MNKVNLIYIALIKKRILSRTWQKAEVMRGRTFLRVVTCSIAPEEQIASDLVAWRFQMRRHLKSMCANRANDNLDEQMYLTAGLSRERTQKSEPGSNTGGQKGKRR